MPTQRPFFANFFSVFRARTSPTFQAKSSPTTGAVTSTSITTSAHTSSGTSNASLPRTITTKTSTENTFQSTTSTTTQPVKAAGVTPFSAAAIVAGSPGTATFYSHPLQLPRTSRPPSPGPANHGLALSPPGHSIPMTRGRPRRGSDSSNSSGGFMDAMGSDKWYIGGRTAGGEERFYKLGLVTGAGSERMRSLDRLSL